MTLHPLPENSLDESFKEDDLVCSPELLFGVTHCVEVGHVREDQGQDQVDNDQAPDHGDGQDHEGGVEQRSTVRLVLLKVPAKFKLACKGFLDKEFSELSYKCFLI